MWYTYRQNNSGGYFHSDENVGVFVSIEADTPEEADSKAFEIFEDYNDYCPCCGERWYIDSDERDGAEEPTYYGKPLRTHKASFFETDAVFYHKDGRKERVIFPKE